MTALLASQPCSHCGNVAANGFGGTIRLLTSSATFLESTLLCMRANSGAGRAVSQLRLRIILSIDSRPT